MRKATAVRRLLAFAMDWLVVVLWGGALFGAVTSTRVALRPEHRGGMSA